MSSFFRRRPPPPHHNAVVPNTANVRAPSAALCALRAKVAPHARGYVGSRGYVVALADCPVELRTALVRELTVRPQQPSAPKGTPPLPTFACHRESTNHLYLPRHYGEALFGPPTHRKYGKVERIQATCNVTPRAHQADALRVFLDHCSPDEGGGGCMELYCAWGKSKWTMLAIAALGVKTLIVLPTTVLVTQWREGLAASMPGVRVGLLQGKTADVDDRDVVLATLMSAAEGEYPKGTFDGFGFLVIDETHHVSSRHMLNVLFRVAPMYTLGLSATMDRADGTTPVFQRFLGPVLVRAKRSSDSRVRIVRVAFSHDDPAFGETEMSKTGTVAMSAMVAKLCAFTPRCTFVADLAVYMVTVLGQRQVMVLSQHKALLTLLRALVDARLPGVTRYFHGDASAKEKQEAHHARIILGTYAQASEGLDIPTIDGLILATPRVNIEQSLGRALRHLDAFAEEDDDEHSVYILVVVDPHAVFQRQWGRRALYYKSVGEDDRATNPDATVGYTILRTTHRTYAAGPEHYQLAHNPHNLTKSLLGKRPAAFTTTDEDRDQDDGREEDDDDQDDQDDQEGDSAPVEQCLLK